MLGVWTQEKKEEKEEEKKEERAEASYVRACYWFWVSLATGARRLGNSNNSLGVVIVLKLRPDQARRQEVRRMPFISFPSSSFLWHLSLCLDFFSLTLSLAATILPCIYLLDPLPSRPPHMLPDRNEDD
jgi:hypothetical protein